MIALALRYWHFAAIGLLLALIGIQTARIASLKASHASYVAKAASDRADAVAKVLITERARTAISEQKAEAHEKTISDLRAAARTRLHALTGKAGDLPSVPDAAFKPDAGAGSDRLCIETAFAVSLMLSADENTAQLIGLQAWVREQQKVAQ